jgi:hypothetical protein
VGKSNAKVVVLTAEKSAAKLELEALSLDIGLATLKEEKKQMAALGKVEKKTASESENRGVKAFKGRALAAKLWTDGAATSDLCFNCKGSFIISKKSQKAAVFSIECDGCKGWSCLVCRGFWCRYRCRRRRR